VMAVPCSELFATAAGKMRADALTALVPASGWQTMSCGDGPEGPRFYDWALIGTTSGRHHLLARRSLTPDARGKLELAFFTCHAPPGTTLAELVAVAGARWAIESCFQAARNETGLDHYQARRHVAWYRHITLPMLAHAFLATTAAACQPAQPPPGTLPASGNASAEPGKKGTRRLWTAIPAAQNR
jgi:hypothetical protein